MWRFWVDAIDGFPCNRGGDTINNIKGIDFTACIWYFFINSTVVKGGSQDLVLIIAIIPVLIKFQFENITNLKSNPLGFALVRPRNALQFKQIIVLNFNQSKYELINCSNYK